MQINLSLTNVNLFNTIKSTFGQRLFFRRCINAACHIFAKERLFISFYFYIVILIIKLSSKMINNTIKASLDNRMQNGIGSSSSGSQWLGLLLVLVTTTTSILLAACVCVCLRAYEIERIKNKAYL